jgi:hypothetical protein
LAASLGLTLMRAGGRVLAVPLLEQPHLGGVRLEHQPGAVTRGLVDFLLPEPCPTDEPAEKQSHRGHPYADPAPAPLHDHPSADSRQSP